MILARVIRKNPVVRDAPSIYGREIGRLAFYSFVQGVSLLNVKPGESWLELESGGYTAVEYPSVNWLGVKTPTIHLQINPPPPRYARLKHDHELYGMDRILWKSVTEGFALTTKQKIQRGDPETVRLLYSDHVNLTKKDQEFWFALLKLAAPHLTDAQLRRGFASLTAHDRCYTNKRGTENGYADYINNVNVNRWTRGVGFETIITGGNVVEITGDKFNKRGKDYYPCLSLDAYLYNPQDILSMGLPSPTNPNPFVHWATISGFDSARGMFVDPFPQLDGRPVPVPNFSRGYQNAVPAERVEFVAPPFEIPYYNSYIKSP